MVSLEEIFLSCLPHYLLQEVVLMFSTYRVSQAFFQSREVCCLAISNATSYDACLLGGNLRKDKSLTFHTRFMASEKLYNFCGVIGMLHRVSKCPINFEGFVYLALRAFIPLQCDSSWMLTTIPQQQTVGRLS